MKTLIMHYNNNNNIPYLYRMTFSVKMLLLSTRVLLKLKIESKNFIYVKDLIAIGFLI